MLFFLLCGMIVLINVVAVVLNRAAGVSYSASAVADDDDDDDDLGHNYNRFDPGRDLTDPSRPMFWAYAASGVAPASTIAGLDHH